MSKDRFEMLPMKVYIAGAAVAVGVILCTSVVLSFVMSDISEDLISLAMYFTTLLSTATAGFLVAGKVYSRYLHVGLITGLFCYLLYIIPTTILTQSILIDMGITLLFFLGPSLGALVRQIRRRTRHVSR